MDGGSSNKGVAATDRRGGCSCGTSCSRLQELRENANHWQVETQLLQLLLFKEFHRVKGESGINIKRLLMQGYKS